MITLIIGNVGSGKSLYMCYRMVETETDCDIYSNIITKKIRNNTILRPEMIAKEEKDEKGKVISKGVNVDFWRDAIEKAKKRNRRITICLDECHILFNSRTIFSNKHRLAFLSLIRKVLTSATDEAGNLFLATQLSRRVDIILREMAQRIIFLLNHYTLSCKCGYEKKFTNLSPEIPYNCPKCQTKLKKNDNYIEIFQFMNITDFDLFMDLGKRTYYKRSRLDDIEKYYKYYDTYQFDDLLT